uniref:Uncharacterized protein n=2 Tax=Oryza barthii TaxID=65489 RepID=A0A0D3EMN9_9ORYZ
MRSLRILSTPTAQRSSAPFIAHCLPLPYLCSVQVVPGIPVSHPPPPSHRRSTLSPISMGSLDLGAAQEDRRHSRRRTRSSSGFLLLPCRMGLLAGDILPSHPQIDLFGSLKLGLVLWIFATPVDSARYGSTAGHAGDEVVPLPHRPQLELMSSPSAAADGAEVIPSCCRRRQTPPLPQWWQLDGSQEKQGKRKGAKRQGKWTVATDRCPLAYCSG